MLLFGRINKNANRPMRIVPYRVLHKDNIIHIKALEKSKSIVRATKMTFI